MTDLGGFDAVTRATAKHGVYRGSEHFDVVLNGEDADGNGPELHAMRRRRPGEAKPAPEAPPEKYYPHGRPPRETAGHAKSAAARTAKDRGKKKKPPTGKGSS